MIGVSSLDDLENNNDTKSPSDFADELNSINRSLTENFAGIIAIVLSTYSYYIQKQQLFCSVEYEPCCDNLPDAQQYKLAAYIIALAIAISSYSSNEEALREPAETCKEQLSNELSLISSLFVLIAAIIDVINILLTGQETQPPFF